MQYRFLTIAVTETGETETAHKGAARGLIQRDLNLPNTEIMNNNRIHWESDEMCHGFGAFPRSFLFLSAQRVEFQQGGATATREQQNCKYS